MSRKLSGKDRKPCLLPALDWGFSEPVNRLSPFSTPPYITLVHLQCVFDHWEVMMADPLAPGSQTNTLCIDIRKRKGIKAEIMPLNEYEDKL